MAKSTSEIDVDFGHADLHCLGSGMNVQLNSCARFATSEEDDIAQLRRRLTAASLTDQSSPKPWIRRSNGFRLVLSVHVEALNEVLNPEEIIDILSAHLEVAKVTGVI